MATPTREIAAQTADQRRATLTLLESLDQADWERPSLCDGWRIHDLVAHLTLPYTSRQTRVLKELVKHRGSFDRAADTMARADAAAHTPAELLDIVRANIDHPWNPPGGGPTGALSHDVIHSWDITDALERPSVVTPDRARTVLAAFKPIHLKGFGVDLATTRFEATDEDFAIGAEPAQAQRTVTAPLLDLVPIATGRRAA